MIETAREQRNSFIQKKAWEPWLVSLTAALFFFYGFIQGNMFASIADDLMLSFQLTAKEMTYLSTAYYVTNVLFLIPAGLILDRYSIKKTILVAFFVSVMTMFVLAFTKEFKLALLCRFLMGLGSAFCFLGPVRIAALWFPPQRMAFVTGIIVTMAMLGGMISQYPLTQLVLKVGWRSALIDLAWLGVFIFILMFFFVKDKPSQTETLARNVSLSLAACLKKAVLDPNVLRAGLYTSLMNMAIAVYGALMGSLYLMQRLNIPKNEASLINAMLFFGTMLGGPFIGWLSDKWRLRILPAKAAALISLLCLLLILFMPLNPLMMKILFFLLGFFTAAQVLSYVYVSEKSPAYMTGTAISVVSILTQGGYVFYQNLFSFILMLQSGPFLVKGAPIYSFQAYQYASLILPLGCLLAFLCVRPLKEASSTSPDLLKEN